MLVLLAASGIRSVSGGDLKVTGFRSHHHYYEEFEGRMVGPRGEALAYRKISLLVDRGDGLKKAHISRLYSDLTDEAGYYDGRVFMEGFKGSRAEVRVRIRLEDAVASEVPYCLGPIATFVFEAYQGLVDLPLFVVGKRIESEFSANINKDKKLSCGGQVLDEQGRPIKDVRVSLRFKLRRSASARTDEQGRWSATMRPDCRVSRLSLRHPEYVHGWHYRPPIEALRQLKYQVTLKRGATVTGVVYDSLGLPVADATLRLSSHRATSSGDGSFQIRAVSAARHRLRIEADGHAPTQRFVQVEPNMPVLDIRLQAGRNYAGRIVDPEGDPISGVKVDVKTWIDAQGSTSYDFREAVSSEDGRFYFSHLPSEGWCILACRRRHEPIIDIEVPDLSEGEPIVLRDAPVFQGRVVDAQNGEPVKTFTLYNGHKWYDDAVPEWKLDRPQQIESQTGSFTHKWYTYSIWHNQSPICLVKLRAKGYLPVVLGPALLGQAPEQVLVRLQADRPLAGKLLSPDGQAAVYADVCWVGLGEKAVVSADGFKAERHENRAQSDAQGRFHLNPVVGPGFIFVMHHSGYAQVQLDRFLRDGFQIGLTPWATVQARVPGFDESAPYVIALQPVDYGQTNDSPHVLWAVRSERLDSGAFCFKRVPSIPLILGRYVNGFIDHPAHLTPTPGQMHLLDIQAQGRPALGRLVFPKGTISSLEDLPSKSDLRVCAFRLDDVYFKGQNAKLEPFSWLWKDRQRVCEASKWRASRRFIPAVHADGRFEFKGLPSGDYELLVNMSTPYDMSKRRKQLLALGHVEFMVPEDGKRPFHIPDVTLVSLPFPNVGDMAPTFTVNTLDGQRISSADLRGKSVLLSFWDWYSKSCVPDFHAHREIHASFKEHDQFLMLGISGDISLDRAKRWIYRRKPPWVQVYEGPLYGSPLGRAFGVDNMPANILIGRDGRILGRDMEADRLKRVLERLLLVPDGIPKRNGS